VGLSSGDAGTSARSILGCIATIPIGFSRIVPNNVDFGSAEPGAFDILQHRLCPLRGGEVVGVAVQRRGQDWGVVVDRAVG
jgi:hypothetical protein